MPCVKICINSDLATISAKFRPSCTFQDEGAQQLEWVMRRQDGETDQETVDEWTETKTGLSEEIMCCIIDVLNALVTDIEPHAFRFLYDREPDGGEPLVVPEELKPSRLLQAVTDLLKCEGMSYR